MYDVLTLPVNPCIDFSASVARVVPVATAARYGVAAGSATVMTPGTDLCHPEDVERLYDEICANPRRAPSSRG